MFNVKIKFCFQSLCCFVFLNHKSDNQNNLKALINKIIIVKNLNKGFNFEKV